MRLHFLLPLLLCAPLALAKAPDAAQLKDIISRIDQQRQPAGGVELQVSLSTLQDGREVEQDAYAITSDGGGNALLAMQNRDKRGQKILSTKQGIWMYFPKTRRPLRLTAVQQLQGNASVGDVLRTRWSEEYKLAADAPQLAQVEGRNCWRVTLEAAQEEATYRKIELYLSESQFAPVKADMYTFGGKLMKSAWYGESANLGAFRLIRSTRIISALDAKNGKETLYVVKAAKNIQVERDAFSLHALEVGQ
ncbi:outer membrane lipoprotein-sorting protein [Massilia sp. W12]|uniref:outer membrane lipoprotein-sorting protein n=1 Tax=Massilia sp. W12 TaxID=3126507 RepID=UPI0030CBA860